MNLPEVPPADDVTEPWWDGTRAHQLLLQRCTQCGHLQHPPRAVCTACSSMEHLDFIEATGGAEIDSYTVVHRSPRPGVEVPYSIARARLDEGPILLTRLVGSNEWQIGDRLALDWLDLADGRALPVFQRPSGDKSM